MNSQIVFTYVLATLTALFNITNFTSLGNWIIELLAQGGLINSARQEAIFRLVVLTGWVVAVVGMIVGGAVSIFLHRDSFCVDCLRILVRGDNRENIEVIYGHNPGPGANGHCRFCRRRAAFAVPLGMMGNAV